MQLNKQLKHMKTKTMNIYQEAVNKFGADHQILKAVEELNELATALMHYRQGKATIEEVQKESVDVQIMLGQIDLIIGEPSDQMFEDKLEKLNIALNK